MTATVKTTVLGFITHPVPTLGLTAPQLDQYDYSNTSSVFGSNIMAAWAYSTGYNSSIAVIDDGFDPTRTALFGNFDTPLSRNFGAGGASNLAEPTGDFHGTTTSGLIGDSGAGGQPVGLAPNATIIGVKVDVGTVPLSEYVSALNYAAGKCQCHQQLLGVDRFRRWRTEQCRIRDMVYCSAERREQQPCRHGQRDRLRCGRWSCAGQ